MTDLYKVLEAKLFSFVEKPGRYTGTEINSVIKKDAALAGVLCFPDLYDIGMSHYGSQILYNLVNSNENWALERAYMPWLDAEKIMREKNIPLYSLENFLPLQVFDFIAFTLSYELQYTNVLAMLSLGKIPVWTRERGENDPIVVAGGIVMANPEPVADFFDVVFVGDGEETIIKFCETMQFCKEKKLSRKDTLQEISKIENAYVPQNYGIKKTRNYTLTVYEKSVSFAKIKDIKREFVPKRQIVPTVESVHDRMCAEIVRGCSRGCRFCAAGYYYRPVRERERGQILEQIKDEIKASGWDEIGLLSLSAADYSQFFDLLSDLKKSRDDACISVKVGVASTRIDAMDEKTQTLLNEISQASSFTVAPEAGSQRLRNVINKDFSSEKILETVEILAKRKINTVKLYFMVGLPSETDEDVDEMIDLIKKCAETLYSHTKRCALNVSLSPFSPKPHTPFQWEALCDLDVIKRRCVKVKNAFSKIKNVKIDYRDPTLTFCESVLARGDRQLCAFLYELFLSGAKFEGWDDNLSLDLWKKTAEKVGVDLEKYTRKIDLDEELPWNVVSTGVKLSFLQKERQAAFEQKTTADCKESCGDCGVCTKGLKTLLKKQAVQNGETQENCEKREETLQENPQNALQKTKIRVTYRKTGRARFMSHRNLMDCVSRAFVAARVPLVFSEGFRRRPKISFAQPLALGAIGENELCDVNVLGETSVNIEKINTLLPQGIEILSQKPIDAKTPSIEQATSETNWRIEATVENLDMGNALKRFISQGVTQIVTRKKEQEVTMTLGASEIKNLSLNEDGNELYFCLPAGVKYRPSDIIKAIFPDRSASDFRVVRENIVVEE